MNALINTFLSDKIMKYGGMISVVLILIALLYIGILYRSLPPVLPLYNQMPWGENRLGTTPEIFILPLLAIGIILGNAFLASILYSRMPLVARALSATTLLISFITIIFVFRTIQLVL